MGKCDTCGKKKYGYLCEGCIHDPDATDKYEPMTNADRIRAMSDEGLAKYLLDVEQGNFTCDICDDKFCDTQNCCHDCTEAVIKWLKQPAEE